jgi:hypothetical protein
MLRGRGGIEARAQFRHDLKLQASFWAVASTVLDPGIFENSTADTRTFGNRHHALICACELSVIISGFGGNLLSLYTSKKKL